ncbi:HYPOTHETICAL PROTEIN MCJ_005880 [Mesomycoplasma conjunctivae]|uniref:Uncharacterized protein n=1 Tax=Mesomycoplasma conjunctivae (strain ATCC 25834 / NCTC 10147 / HRC/581) TaxID=572263 RepID=C5J722_MESCH|nr:HYPOTHETICAL PROTEIN MCJ_005880 [Mesomycoplasma conjunctivae]
MDLGKIFLYIYKLYKISKLSYCDLPFFLEQTSQDIFDKFPISLH